jgi:FkbM family methyltransferase
VRAALLRLTDALRILLEPGGFSAFLTWPKFSLTSFKMTLDLKRQGIAPKTVIDVGANVGQFAVAAAKQFPGTRIFSFEPVPATVNELRNTLAGVKDVTIYPLALGESEGEIAFNVNAVSHASSALHVAPAHLEASPAAQEIGQISVKVSTLDSVFADIPLMAPVLLKLDVQGYEASVLRGAVNSLERIDYAILETSFKPMYEGEVLFFDMIAIMKSYGFDFLRPVGWFSNPKTGEILQMDMLFARR